MAILDFLYFGEANVYQEDLDSFLTIAEQLKLKGLTDQTSADLLNPQETPENIKPVIKSKELFMKPTTFSAVLEPNVTAVGKVSRALAIPNEFIGDMKALDEKVKSLMEKGQHYIPDGKQSNGTPRRTIVSICKVCGKEGLWNRIRNHVETNHLEGISIPCVNCEKIFTSRVYLSQHKSKCKA